MTADVSIAAALFAGVLSFLSPCVLPLVPPYLVYLAGTSLERLADAEPEPMVRTDTVLAALLFVAGFSTVFIAFGASASAIGGLVQAWSAELGIVAGVAIIVMGTYRHSCCALMRQGRATRKARGGRQRGRDRT